MTQFEVLLYLMPSSLCVFSFLVIYFYLSKSYKIEVKTLCFFVLGVYLLLYQLKALFLYVAPVDELTNGIYLNGVQISNLLLIKVISIENVFLLFFVFGLILGGYIFKSKGDNQYINHFDYVNMRVYKRKTALYLQLFSFFFMTFLAVLMSYLHIGFMGVRGAVLSYGLNTIIVYSFQYGIPIVLLTSIVVAFRQKKSSYANIGLILFIYFAVLEVIVRGTRSSVLNVGMYLSAAYFFIAPENGKKIIKYIFVASLISMLMFPLVTAYRYSNIFGLSIASFFSDGLFDIYSIDFFAKIFGRLTGSEGMFMILGNEEYINRDIVSEFGTFEYFTRFVIQVPEDSVTMATPSAVGQLYMLYGYWGVTLGSFFVGVLLKLMITLGKVKGFHLRIVYFSMLTNYSFWLITGGTSLFPFIKSILIIVVFFIICDFYLKLNSASGSKL